MTVLSRQALYDLVWTDPLRSVAQELGLSDVSLKKICLKADIPVPQRGYWAKLRAHQAVKPAMLPPRGPGMPQSVHIGEHAQYRSLRSEPEAELAEPVPNEPQFDEAVDELRHRVAAKVGAVGNQRNLKAPHPLIQTLLADDEKRRLKPSNASWRLRAAEPLFESAFERRRLRVLSSIFTGLQRFGAQPWVSDDEARRIGAVVGAARVSFRLDHPSAKPDHNGRWQTRAGWADELRFSIEGEGAQTWCDTEQHGLEAHLTEIVVQLIVSGELHYRAAARGAYERTLQRRRELEAELARRRAEAARQAREAQIAAETSRRTQLLNMAADLRAADDIRKLVERVLAKKGVQDEAARRWGAWALNVAEGLDPSGRLTFDATGCVKETESEDIASAPDPREL